MSIVVRVYSKVGANRLELPSAGTIKDLKQAISAKLNITNPKICKD